MKIQRSVAIKAISFKARGLIGSNVEILKDYIKNAKPQIIFVQETLLDESVEDETVAIEGYHILRRDHNSGSGGVAIYTEKWIRVDGNPYFNPVIEAMSITVTINGTDITLTNFSKPSDMSEVTLWDQLRVHYAVSSVNSHFSVIAGDFCFVDPIILRGSMNLTPSVDGDTLSCQIYIPCDAEILEKKTETPIENLQCLILSEFKLLYEIDNDDAKYLDPKCFTSLKGISNIHQFLQKYKTYLTAATLAEEKVVNKKAIFKFFLELDIKMESVDQILAYIEAEFDNISSSLELHLKCLFELYCEYKNKLKILSKMPDDPIDPHLDWNTESANDWKEQAVEAQMNFAEKNGTFMWEKYDRFDLIETKICIALFGNDIKQNASLESNPLFLYDHEQRQAAQRIRKRMWKFADKTRDDISGTTYIYMTIVYVTVQFELDKRISSYPVFAFKAKDNVISYFDHYANYYETWKTYLNYNTLPKCMMCVPVNGFYGLIDKNNNVETEYMFRESPACTLKNRIINTASTAVKYVSAALPILGILFPPLFGFLGLAKLTTAFQMVNSAFKWINFSIAVGNFACTSYKKITLYGERPEYQDILNIVVAFINIATEKINKSIVNKALDNKVLLTALESAFLTFINSAVFAITASSTLSAFCVLLFKEKIEPSDLINLSLSLYYLHGAWMRPKTGEGVFRELKEIYDYKKQELEREEAMKKDKEKQEKIKKYGELAEKEDLTEEEKAEIQKELEEQTKKITNPDAKIHFDEKIKGKTIEQNNENKDKKNEFYEDVQLIRLMLHVDNVNDFFCELRSGETTFKFKPDGEIIINREIQIHPLRLNELVKSNQPLVEVKNPDGTISKVSVADRRCTLISQLKTNPAAQAELDTLQASDREKLFQATHDIQKNDNIWTTVQSHIPIWKYFCPTHRSDDNDRRTQYAYFEKNYHLMFNVHCDDVKRDLSKILPEWSKDDMFCDLSPTELGKLSHVIKETNDPDIWKAAKVLAQNSGCSNVREFCDYVRLTKVIANEPFVRETAAKFQANGNQFDGKILQNAEVQAAMTTCINDYKNQIQHILSKNDTIWDNPLSATCHAVETCREENCEDKQISEKALKEFLLKEDPFDTKSLSSQHFRVETGYTQDGKERVTYVTNLNDLPSPPKPGVPESMQWTVKGVIADLAIDALTAATLTYGLLGRKFASTILKNPTSLAARLIAQRFGRTAAVRKTRIKRSVGFKKNVLPITTVKKVAQNTIAKGRRYKVRPPNSKIERMPPVYDHSKTQTEIPKLLKRKKNTTRIKKNNVGNFGSSAASSSSIPTSQERFNTSPTNEQCRYRGNQEKFSLLMKDPETLETKTFLVASIDFPPPIQYKGAIKFNVPNSGLEHIVLCHGRKFAEHIDRFSFDYFDPEQKLIFDEIQAASDINQKQLLINRLHELITQNKTVENQLHLMQMRVVEFLKNHINAESYFASYKSNDQNINYLFKTDHHNVAHLITVTTTNRPFELDIASEKWLEITTAVIEDKDVVRSRLSAHA